MKRMVRFILVFTLLVVVAQPTFACVICDGQGDCTWGGGLRCKPTIDGYICGAPCGGGGGGLTESLAGEFSIASVEVTHGTEAKVAVAEKKTDAPAVVADSRLDKSHK